jgi:hypothetical protein
VRTELVDCGCDIIVVILLLIAYALRAQKCQSMIPDKIRLENVDSAIVVIRNSFGHCKELLKGNVANPTPSASTSRFCHWIC